MAEESGGENWWGAWGTDFLSNVKAKSAETLSLVKQDLSEFVTTIQHDTTVTVAETAANVKDKLKVEEDETDSSTTAVIRQGVSQWLGSLSTALKENVSQMTALVDEEPTSSVTVPVFDRIQARVHEIQTDTSTYCNDPDGHPAHFVEWSEKFDLEQHKAEISELLVNTPEIRSLYTKLVPSAVTNYHFWTRYFYKIHRFQQEEKRKAALVERANKMEEEDLGWGDEEDCWEIEDSSSKNKTKDSTSDELVLVEKNSDTNLHRENEDQAKEITKQNNVISSSPTEELTRAIDKEVIQTPPLLEAERATTPDEKKSNDWKIAEDLTKQQDSINEKTTEQIASSTDLKKKPILPNKTVNQPNKVANEGPHQSSTPDSFMEENAQTTSEPIKAGSNDDLNREHSSDSSVDSSWSKISEEDLNQNNGQKTCKDPRDGSRLLQGPSSSPSERSSSSMVVIPTNQDKNVIDIDWDDDDDFGDDITDDSVKVLTDGKTNKDVKKSSEVDDDDDDWEKWE